MSVSLKKGQKISLSKERAGLSLVVAALGWDEAKQPKKLFAKKPDPIDCDASALLLTNGHLANKNDMVYFGGLTHLSGAVRHLGDNLTGEGEGDDEQIIVELDKLPPQYERIVFFVNIFRAARRNQHFGMIENAYIRILDGKSGTELCRYDLTDNYSGMTAMIFGELYLNAGEWKFNAIGQGTNDLSVDDVAERYM